MPASSFLSVSCVLLQEDSYWQHHNDGQLTLPRPNGYNCHFANCSKKVAIRNVKAHQKIALGTLNLTPDIMLVCTGIKMGRICTKMLYTFIISDFYRNGGHLLVCSAVLWSLVLFHPILQNKHRLAQILNQWEARFLPLLTNEGTAWNEPML